MATFSTIVEKSKLEEIKEVRNLASQEHGDGARATASIGIWSHL